MPATVRAVVTFSIVVIAAATLAAQKQAAVSAPVQPQPTFAAESASKLLEQGRRLFEDYSCFDCHGPAGVESGEAPSLRGLSGRMSQEQMLTAILEPSHSFAADFTPVTVVLSSGQVLSGYLAEKRGGVIVLRSGQTLHTFKESEVEELVITESNMPTGLLDGVSEADRKALLAYLIQQ